MTINLFNGSNAKFFIIKDKQQTAINLSSGRIEFSGIKSDSYGITALMKRPEIKINGTASFDKLRSNNPYQPTKPWTFFFPVSVKGNTILKLDYINDNYDKTDTPQHITFFKWIRVGNDTNTNVIRVAPFSGSLLQVPWQDVIKSKLNNQTLITILISAVTATILTKWSLTQKSKSLQKNK